MTWQHFTAQLRRRGLLLTGAAALGMGLLGAAAPAAAQTHWGGLAWGEAQGQALYQLADSREWRERRRWERERELERERRRRDNRWDNRYDNHDRYDRYDRDWGDRRGYKPYNGNPDMQRGTGELGQMPGRGDTRGWGG